MENYYQNRDCRGNRRQKPDINLSQLTSFLKFDDSFFSPWNHKEDCQPLCSSCGKDMVMQFDRGSFFSYDVSAKDMRSSCF